MDNSIMPIPQNNASLIPTIPGVIKSIADCVSFCQKQETIRTDINAKRDVALQLIKSRHESLEHLLNHRFTERDRLFDRYFQVKVDGDACAVIDFVDIDFEKKSAEGGFYILKEYARNGYSISRCANTLCNSIGLKTIYTHVLKFNQKAVLYNLIKLKGHLLKEDENSVYFSFQMYADNFQKEH